MPIESKNAITYGGKPVMLFGQELKVGDIAPEFITLINNIHRNIQLSL